MNSPQIIAGLMETIRLQATLLSDAQDIFDELGAGTVWATRMEARLGYDPVAHQRQAAQLHDTNAAQLGL